MAFFIVYYFLIGGLCCWYFYKYKRKDFEKEGWHVYLFFYGARFRIALSVGLAVSTADLCLYGAIQIVNE